MTISGVGEMGVGETGVGEMGQIIGETGVGEMGVGETGTSRLNHHAKRISRAVHLDSLLEGQSYPKMHPNQQQQVMSPPTCFFLRNRYIWLPE